MKCECIQDRYACMLQVLALGGSVSDHVLKQLEREVQDIQTQEHQHVMCA